MTETEKEIRNAVVALQKARKRLSDCFADWTFTLDGNLVGNIGEAYAYSRFEVTKEGTNTQDHDFIASDKKLVQVKMTQRSTLGLGIREPNFEHLIALHLRPDGAIEVLYNGPGWPIYTRPGRPHRRSVPIAELRERNQNIQDSDRVPERKNPVPKRSSKS